MFHEKASKLKPVLLKPFTPAELKPAGWLLNQLNLQADGLNGNLDKIWPDIKESKWIGGKEEGWERVPYWLDGFIPLAWLLDDEDRKGRARVYIDAILSKQEEDGWICPCEKDERGRYDVWAVFLICKVLVCYYECSGDERIEGAVEKALKNLDRHIEGVTLFNWGLSRWYECLIPIYWLYERKPQDWLLELADKLRMEGLDYQRLFQAWPFTESGKPGEWSYLSHVVNIAMSLKSGALIGRMDENVDGDGFARRALSLLQRDHGMANGHFTGDECLAGNSPIQGSECCSVVEAMYSYEWLLSLTGSAYWGDMLEKTAFNALPATLSPDMWTHQYDQQTNQVQCAYLPAGKVVFHTNGEESHLFGLEPNFGCCTANFGQGFPKFALSCLMKTERGLAVTAVAPVKAASEWKGISYTCEIATQYPFRDGYEVILHTDSPLDMELDLRIPGFADSAKVNGEEAKPGVPYTVIISGETDIRIAIELEFQPHFEERPREMACVWRGPLLYALPIAEKWVPHEFVRNGVERKKPYCDYEVLPTEKWNYAYCGGGFETEYRPVGPCPFSPKQAPVALRTKLCEIDWKLENGVCTAEPESREPLSPPEDRTLIPYGCTNLRLAEMPLIGAD